MLSELSCIIVETEEYVATDYTFDWDFDPANKPIRNKDFTDIEWAWNFTNGATSQEFNDLKLALNAMIR